MARMFTAMAARKPPARKTEAVRKLPAAASDGEFAGFLHTLNLSRTRPRTRHNACSVAPGYGNRADVAERRRELI